MPDFNSPREGDFSKYDQMTDKQLCQILRADAKCSGCEETDMELILYVMEVLAKRREERNEHKDPKKALQSFKQHYLPNDETVSQQNQIHTSSKKKNGTWRRIGAIAAAAVLIIIIGGTATANAFGFNIFEIVGKWSKETFHFGSVVQTDATEPSEDVTLPYASLQEMLDKHEIRLKLVPSWIPTGYESFATRVQETPKQRQFIAAHKCGDKMIKVQIKDYLTGDPEKIEQSEDLLEVYSANGVAYYIFSDIDQLRAAWIIENYECYISGPLSIEEMKHMIDSIGKG